MLVRPGSLYLISCIVLLHTVQAEAPVVVGVLVQSYGDLPPGIMQRAQRDAAGIFRRSGIELRWLSAEQVATPLDLEMVILPEATATKLQISADQFGRYR